ncbi:hypothetical protein ACTOWA_00320 [Herbaspirillum seropedicae]|uniref:hypothetical protein n=1 Tax=Herbaspirillum seropedicae TaxID=964 RepID=UPI00286310BA|nr:hypothetical protein [Herbaspirillum seropedicae]MDR6397966.1 hypothetical protein [Herbaspirillum seropedicae]
MNTHNATQNATQQVAATFAGLSAPCCYEGRIESCVCGVDSDERALRAYNQGIDLPPMTATQREFCLKEISAVEGYDRADYTDATDGQLANGVLCAWMDSARDKGMA